MSVRALSPAERNRFSRAPVLAPLTLADIALEALLADYDVGLLEQLIGAQDPT